MHRVFARRTGACARASSLHMLLCALAIGCGATAPVVQPTPAPVEPEAPTVWVPDPIVVGDQRPDADKQSDRRVGQANSAMGGGLREAELDCASAAAADHVTCTRAHSEARRKAARERMDRRYAAMQSVGEAVEACESRANEAAREACADTIEKPESIAPESELHSAIDWRWARQVYGCADASEPISLPCRAIAALTRGVVDGGAPEGRWVGAGVLRTYVDYVHHDLLAIELQASGENLRLCAMPLPFDSADERRSIEVALLELFSGRQPEGNPAYERAASHTFEPEHCKQLRQGEDGRWQSGDGRWVLGPSANGLSFRARDWGPQVAFLLAELRQVSAD